jgi:hypothetical protein
MVNHSNFWYVTEAEFAKGGLEQGVPLAVVQLGEIKDNRDVGADVDGLDNGGRRGREHLLLVGGGG